MKKLKKILSRPNGLAGGLMLGFVLLVAGIGSIYTPYDPTAQDYLARFEGPSGLHPLGTDMFGRDLLSRLLAGAGVSVTVSFLTVAAAVTGGVIIGAFCGYWRGWFDRLVMMVVEALMAFPGILLALALMVAIGPNKYGVVLALALAYLPSVTRLVRGTVLSLREKEYIEASVALGNGTLFTLFRHVLPNSLGPLIVLSTTMFGWVLLAESSLAFLGLGVPPPAPTWGNMLAEARSYLMRFPWLGILPGICISFALLGVNLFGDALRDELDPRNN
ncbi:ABC transporter permease [Nitratireductor aquimarinus]|uniref:ABC transporter permease n=1 Tax=Nitratireductor aquimarinus TaxID=889300 RepID=A0ABU4AQS3_9HYPH|nr:ABC transporter permease [Nitratireductor aquimarinus]MDV6228594.1 ABC transporter permease [Nitratireductor aquimarinus]